MKHLFQIACFLFLAANCPSFTEEVEECDTEVEAFTAEKMNEMISKLDTLSKKLENQVEQLEDLNEEAE